MGAFKNQAEEWFARYLDAQGGYTMEYEPELGVTTVPDFLVERDGVKVVCEIKGFEKIPKLEERLSSGQPIAAGNDEVYSPIRGAVREAARTLSR